VIFYHSLNYIAHFLDLLFIKKVVDAKSTGTVSTEGSIADDKSHASKEPDVASFPAVKSWGGGRSFADILKTQEA